jgi:type III secretory pathway component EscR
MSKRLLTASLAIGGIAMLVSLLAVAPILLIDQQNDTPEAATFLQDAIDVVVVHVSANDTFAKRISNRRQPVVIRNSIVSQWKAIRNQTWTPEALRSKLGSQFPMANVKQGTIAQRTDQG